MKKATILCFTFAFVIFSMTCIANANLINNGSFENGTDPGASFLTINGTDSTTITGWTVQGIDYIGGYWQASDGERSIDLNGFFTAGSISQTFNTVVGQRYDIMFDLAGNTDGEPTIKTILADAGSASNFFTFDITGASHSNMGWETETLSFIANTDQTTLTFASANDPNGAFGPAIDNVNVNAVPEPATMLLISAGLFGLGSLRKFIKK